MAKRKDKQFADLSEINSLFTANPVIRNRVAKLPPGVYELKVDDRTNAIYYNMVDTNHDEIIDLPSPEYSKVIKQIEMFLSPECRARFEEKKYLYKRSILLHGKPGTGKTCIINRIVEHVTTTNGVVLFNPNPRALTEALTQLKDIQPETPIVVVFEELDKLMAHYEGELLTILDGEIQKENIIYLATTNFLSQIPPRIRRPGRFNNLVEVGFPSAEVRRFYLLHKLGENALEVEQYVADTDGLSIDELSEIVRQVYCLKEDFKETLTRIRKIREECGHDSRDIDNPYDSDDSIDMDAIRDGIAAISKRGSTKSRR